MDNIVLAGFMGTGKTSVGKALAVKLGMDFIDLDDVIEGRERRKINDIFAQDGEPYFRQVEKEVVKDFSQRGPSVLATGGGAIVDEDNLLMLQQGGTVILLEADVDTIIERTSKEGHRPLLLVEDPRAKIEALLAARAEAYNKADHKIDTSSLSVDEVADEIVKIVQK